jgi:hypothetical protein
MYIVRYPAERGRVRAA